MLFNREERKRRNKSLILGILILALVFGCVFSVWHISKARMNEEPKKAFEAVLEEYKLANEMGFFEYYSSREDFKYVSPRAMMLMAERYNGFPNLYYDYYDLNYDGIDELLIGFRLTAEEGKYFSTEDVLVYINDEVKSVFDDSWLRVDEQFRDSIFVDESIIYGEGYTDSRKITYVPIELEKNNSIEVVTMEYGDINCQKKSWYKLDEKGEKLVLDREFECYYCGEFPEDVQICYENGKEITKKEYFKKTDERNDVYDPGNSGGPMHYKPIFR